MPVRRHVVAVPMPMPMPRHVPRPPSGFHRWLPGAPPSWPSSEARRGPGQEPERAGGPPPSAPAVICCAPAPAVRHRAPCPRSAGHHGGRPGQRRQGERRQRPAGDRGARAVVAAVVGVGVVVVLRVHPALALPAAASPSRWKRQACSVVERQEWVPVVVVVGRHAGVYVAADAAAVANDHAVPEVPPRGPSGDTPWAPRLSPPSPPPRPRRGGTSYRGRHGGR